MWINRSYIVRLNTEKHLNYDLENFQLIISREMNISKRKAQLPTERPEAAL